MKKGLTVSLVCLLFSLALVLPVTAIDITLQPTERFFVNDFANVLDNTTENELYNMGVQLYEKTTAQVVAVTVPSLDGADIDEYGVTLGREWGIGGAEENNGVLLLLSVGDREVRIDVGYGLEGALTDARTGIILDNYAIPHFQNDDFSEGMKQTYNALINEVYIEYGMEPDPDYTPVNDLEAEDGSFPLFVLIIFLFLFVVPSLPFVRRHLPWLIIANSHHHHHGGGFGGFGGGSHGGGFSGGGGSFGGGGSSRGF